MRYYLGLDNGGTTTKAALFAQYGEEMGVASVDTAMLTPKPGFVERDMEEMWQANCVVIRRLLERTGVDAGEIVGVGICGHGKGLYLWGKNGKPARNGIISTDNRAYAYPARWQANGTAARAYEKTCQNILACQPVALLAWLQDQEPEVMEQIQWIFEAKDYVRFRLTGKAMAELTDISGTSLLNLHTRDYDDELLAMFGLGKLRKALPPLCRATEICGTVTPEAAAQCGLKAGTPVIGGMFDVDACALATGITDEKNLCMIAGTWAINEYLRKEPVTDGSVLMNSLFCLPEYYLIEESSPTSAGNQAWFMRQLLPELRREAEQAGQSIYDMLNHWVEEITPEEFVPVFLPFLLASNAHPNGRGAFVGMTAAHNRKHLLRSVYEGVAFSHRWHYEKLMHSWPGGRPDCIRLAGGAARSRVWAQIFADAMNCPVETVMVNETGALGCAVAVATAVGDYGSMAEAAGAMVRVSARLEPNRKHVKIYDRKYQLYCRTIRCLNELWSDMQALIEMEEE